MHRTRFHQASRGTLALLAALVALAGCESFLTKDNFVTKDVRPTASVNVVAGSQFNHRGMVNVNNWVLVPEIGVQLNPLRAWPEDENGLVARLETKGYLGLTEKNEHAWFNEGQGGKFHEIDFKAELSRRVPVYEDYALDLALGSLSYITPNASFFPNGARGSTTEVFATLASELFRGELWSIYPHFTVHYDPDEVDGFYWVGGIGKSLGLRKLLQSCGLAPEGGESFVDRFTLAINATIAYSSLTHSEWTYGLEEAGWADFSGSGTLFFRLDKNTVLSAGVGGAAMLDDSLREWFDDIDVKRDNVWVNFGIGWEFGSSS